MSSLSRPMPFSAILSEGLLILPCEDRLSDPSTTQFRRPVLVTGALLATDDASPLCHHVRV